MILRASNTACGVLANITILQAVIALVAFDENSRNVAFHADSVFQVKTCQAHLAAFLVVAGVAVLSALHAFAIRPEEVPFGLLAFNTGFINKNKSKGAFAAGLIGFALHAGFRAAQANVNAILLSGKSSWGVAKRTSFAVG